MGTHTHTHTHVHIHRHVRAHKHTYARAQTNTCAHTQERTYTHAHSCTHAIMSMLQVKVQNSTFTRVKVQNVLKLPKVESSILQNVPFKNKDEKMKIESSQNVAL